LASFARTARGTSQILQGNGWSVIWKWLRFGRSSGGAPVPVDERDQGDEEKGDHDDQGHEGRIFCETKPISPLESTMASSAIGFVPPRAETIGSRDLAMSVATKDPSGMPSDAACGGACQIGDFRIARGGPFYELQRRIGLLRERALRAGRRAALLVGLAWGVPLLLSALTGHAVGPLATRPFLLDLGAWARFFIAIGIFVLMERLVEERLRVHLRQFVRAPLLAPGAMPAAAEAVVRALRRRDAWPAELVCVVAAYALTLSGAALLLTAESSSWLVTVSPSGASLTAAGWWCALVSSPLFWFLLLRWLWRHAVWGLLLRDLARLELRLVATHPDGAGGLAFIGQYPNAFAALVFAMSCVLGAAIAQTLLQGGMTPATYGQLLAAWLVIVIILFGAAPGLHQAPAAAQGGNHPGRQLGRHPPRTGGRTRAARRQYERGGRR
jgi:hypothetical protein